METNCRLVWVKLVDIRLSHTAATSENHFQLNPDFSFNNFTIKATEVEKYICVAEIYRPVLFIISRLFLFFFQPLRTPEA